MIFDKETAVVVLDAGEPAGPDSVEEFLRQSVLSQSAFPLPLHKRPFRSIIQEAALKEAVASFRRDLADIALDSPLWRVLGAQANGMAAHLGCEGYVAMVHGEPSLAATVDLMLKEGMKRCIVVPMNPHGTPQGARGGVRKFLEIWSRESGGASSTAVVVDDWSEDGDVQTAMAAIYRETLELVPRDGGIVFLAMDPGAGAVAEDARCEERVVEQFRAMIDILSLGERAHLAWLPARLAPSRLGPSVEEVVNNLADRRVSAFSLVPFGWVSDCFATLHGIDIHCCRLIRQHKLRVYRVPTMNDRPEFIAALAAHVQRRGRQMAA